MLGKAMHELRDCKSKESAFGVAVINPTFHNARSDTPLHFSSARGLAAMDCVHMPLTATNLLVYLGGLLKIFMFTLTATVESQKSIHDDHQALTPRHRKNQKDILNPGKSLVHKGTSCAACATGTSAHTHHGPTHWTVIIGMGWPFAPKHYLSRPPEVFEPHELKDLAMRITHPLSEHRHHPKNIRHTHSPVFE